MKRLLTSLACICICLQGLFAQKPELRFNKEGKFKIVQFTDVHFIYEDPRSDIALERINEVLDNEKPDLVLLTGDIVFSKPAEQGMRTVLEQVFKRNIPFGVTLGNHDDEHDLSRAELLELIQTIPCNITTTAPGISGVGNYIVPLKSATGDKDAAILYCLDSHAYSSIEGIEGYDYIKFDQIQWYRKNSRRFTQANGGTPLPSLAFFHIPLPEYNQAAADEQAILIGTRKEKACAPQLNTGMFAAMKENKDIMGVFVGHDHDCDYVVNWKGILLGYGRYTGGNTVYNNLGSNGARIIELTEGSTSFKTWIRLKDDQTIQHVTYPDDFLKK
ncbi:MAG: metallophosphoesterase family protein [Tannerellaceae bacterium]|nr:metallophosphoesterase family protein [Tannerellaceae bacterium]